MTDTTTSPSGTVDATPLSFDQGIDAIENLLSDDPEMDLAGSDEATGSEEKSEVSNDDDEPELSLDDDELGEAAEVETQGSDLSDETEIVLDDGEKITLAQLKRNNLFQRDYTRKTEELKQQKIKLDQEHEQRVAQATEEIRKQREFILEFAGEFIPQEPTLEMLREDPIGYMEAKATFEERMKKLNALAEQRQGETQKLTAKQQQEAEEFAASEWGKFLDAIPKLKDEKKLEAFRNDVKEIAIKDYGLAPEELKAVIDHRYQRVLHDAIAYRKLVQKSKTVPEKVAAKPKLQANKQRMSIPDVKARDETGRFQALKKNPNDLRAATLSIMDTLGDL